MSRGSSTSSCTYTHHPRRSCERLAVARMSVADVYDIAADIGKEFEQLIDSHGPEHVSSLMQKVISALEHLERFSSQSDQEEATIEQLRTTVRHFELEESKKLEERQRNAQELEQVEDHYKQETRDLLSTVKRLQDENRKLASSLAAATERDSAFSEDEAYFEVDLVNRLQSVIEKQRSQIKKLDQSVLDYKTENEELKCHNEKLSSCTRDLRRKNRVVQSQLHEMVDERAEFTAKLNDSQRQVQSLTQELGSAAKECQDLAQSSKENEVDLRGKIVFSADDPARPRFTLQELKEILQERNSLKAKVSDLEDELAVYRPRTTAILSSPVNSPHHSYRVRMGAAGGPANCDCSYHSRRDGSVESDDLGVVVAKEADGGTLDPSDDEDEDDLPVQGPLPEDPEDAPWRRHQESGIRKLFLRVFRVGHSFSTSSPVAGEPCNNFNMHASLSTPALSQSSCAAAANAAAADDDDYGPCSRSPPLSRTGSLRKSLSRLSFLLTNKSEEEEASASASASASADAARNNPN